MNPSDTMPISAKRKAVNEVFDYQARHQCTRFEACLSLSWSHKEVARWIKELGDHDSAANLKRAIHLYDTAGISIRDAARRAMVAERDLTKALRSRGRRHYTTPHIAMHNIGHHTVAY